MATSFALIQPEVNAYLQTSGETIAFEPLKRNDAHGLTTVLFNLKEAPLNDAYRAEQVEHLTRHIKALDLDLSATRVERDSWKAQANRTSCYTCFPPEKEMAG